MTEVTTGLSIVQIERRVLQALCQGTSEGPVLAAGKVILQNYRWRETVHEVVFSILASMSSDDTDIVRDQLPSRLTRHGFPDVVWEDFFQPHSISKEEAERLMGELRDSSSRRPSGSHRDVPG